MFGTKNSSSADATLMALHRSLAIIEFTPDGLILSANDNFCRAMGYFISDLLGKHHSLFCEASYRSSSDYKDFWLQLKKGAFKAGEFMRVTKSGQQIWLQATYNPVTDHQGNVLRVIKLATDVTAKKTEESRMMTMIERMPVAVMTADPNNDFKINYLNGTSKTTLGLIEQYLPIKVADMLGSSIDVFHKSPGHQRQMLKDSSRLPHRTKIRLGPETLDLQVTAITDHDGKYLGPMLTWSIATAHVTMTTDVSAVVGSVANAVDKMQRAAEGLTGSADQSRAEAESVAANSIQMTGSIREISSQVGLVSERAQQIAVQAGTTDQTVRLLAENAGKVDAVVAMIKSIAEQTNLLALNATIEAARAGESGRGFAVVANEVKALAAQTAKATDEITHRVAAIQTAIGGAVQAIETITGAVGELSNLTVAMAAAVDEQTHSTQAMSTSIGSVSEAANRTGQLAVSVHELAARVAAETGSLTTTMDRFVKAN